jgi:serine/threonine protein kinase/tetratricopeptide (TPR) repeat protein
MISLGVIGSVRLQKEPPPCAQCGSTSRVGRSLCLKCLLYRGLGEETFDSETLESVLDEVDVRDADWHLGNYQILDEIGRGGMGVIYRARQRHSRRIVALKRILAYHADSRETLVRFRREAEAAASLDHPNILPIYEVGEGDDGLPFFSMKLATGGSLLESHVALHKDPRRSVALMAKVSRAVQYAHTHGILHRDLKPGNILLDGHGEPMVSDFGLAKWLDTTSDLTRTLTIFGTPGYIAPEQAHGPAASLKPTADVYSLGAILFDLLAGRPPFVGEHALNVIQQAADKPAPKLRGLKPSLDRDLETMCSRCLEREPNVRYQSAGDLAEDLERWLEGRPIIARPVSPAVRTLRWSKRNPKLAGSIAACLLLGVAAGALQIQNRVSERSAAIAFHSIAIEPVLDLDTAHYDVKESNALQVALRREFSNRGPARVISVSAARSTSTGTDYVEATDHWNSARTAIQGTRRIHDGKLRVSLRLLNTSDHKVLYKKIIEMDVAHQPGDALARLTASQLYTILDIHDLGSAELAEIDPGWIDPNTRELLIAGRAVEDRHALVDIDRAIELFRKAVDAQPSSVLAHSLLAQALWGRGALRGDNTFLQSSATSAHRALDLDPNSPEAHKAMSMVFYGQGRFNEALEEALISLELADSTDDYRLVNRITSILKMLGEPAKAIAWYQLTFKNSDRPFDSASLGDCYLALGDDSRAGEEYRRASTLFPEQPEGWIGLCRLALLQKDFDAAHKIASENWQRYRDFAFSEQMAAQVAFFSRNFAEAEKLYKELATKDPNGGASFHGVVSYQSALGRLGQATPEDKGATEILRRELKKELDRLHSAPQHPEILYQVAAIEASLKKIEPSMEHLQEAINAGWIDYRSLDLDPRFDALRTQPGFKDILAHLQTKVEEMRRHIGQPMTMAQIGESTSP